MKAIRKTICVFGSAVIFLLWNGCLKKETTPQQAIIAYSITAEPDSLDPQIADTAEEQLLVMNLFEGLVRQDADGQPVAGAADTWTVSADKTVYTFTLRPDACWSNGDAVTAEDFLFGWQRALNPATGSEGASVLYAVKNAEAIHKGEIPLSALGVYAREQRLIVELSYPDPDFLTMLTYPAAMPCQQAFFTETGGQYGREADKLLCNGAFYLGHSGWSHESMLYLRRNPFYHGAAVPVPAGVDIAIQDPPEDVCQAIQQGIVDCYTLPCHALEQAQQAQLSLTDTGEIVWGLYLNPQNDLLQNEAVRCALLSALDRSFILQEVPEGCTAVSEIIPDTVRFNGKSYRSQAPSGRYPAYSPHAKEMLQKALSALSLSQPFQLTILCADDAVTQAITNNIMQVWNEVTGRYVNKKPVPAETLQKAVSSGQYQAVIAPLIPENDRPEGILSQLAPSLSDSHYDTLLRDIRTTTGQQSPAKTIEAEQYISRKGVFYPFYTQKICYACSPDVSGILFHAYDNGIDFFFASKTHTT